MKKAVSATAAVVALAAALLLGGAAESRAQQSCTTQGAFALAIVQVINPTPPISTQDAAISYLTGIGVVPDEGWKRDVCLTEPVRKQIQADLALADTVLVKGAADSAESALKKDDRYFISPIK